MQIRSRLTALALALAASGCAGGQTPQGGGGPFAAAADGPRTVTIHVTNLNFNEARLWAVSRGGRERLGVVGGKGDAVYRISWPVSEPMQIEIDLLAGPSCVTEPLEVDPGDDLELQIAVDLSQQPNCY